MEVKVERQVLTDILIPIIEGSKRQGYDSLSSSLLSLKQEANKIESDPRAIAQKVKEQLNFQIMQNIGQKNPEFFIK